MMLIEPLLELDAGAAGEWARSLSNDEFRRATEDRIAALSTGN
jgi:hypothetical protein